MENTNLVPAKTSVTIELPTIENLAALSSLKEVYNMNPAYRTVEEWATLKDTAIRCFFLGMKDIPNEEGEAVQCAIFADAKQIFLCAQFIIVESMRNEEKNTPFQITYKGKKANKSSKGSTNLFDIVKLG